MSKKNEKLAGVAVPLGALYTKNNPVIGEFADLIPFANFCQNAGIKIIQLLPINDTGTQSSPYSGLSAFALHPIYVRLSDVPGFSELCKSEPKFKADYEAFVKANQYKDRYNYDEILNSKTYFLQQLYQQTETAKSGKASAELAKFIKANPWISTYAVYKNLKWKYMQAGWKSWDKTDKLLSEEEIKKRWNDKKLLKDHLFYAWCQMICAAQMAEAVAQVRKLGILLKGDMPILMNDDSCDVWAYPQFFNQNLKAGAPADGENPTGQNWGFPTYNWKNLKTADYSWWIDRLKNAENYYDAYRLDHILGFFRIWAIPADDCNALNGHTEPYAFIKRDELYELGFDDDRIRWMSQPHIPTGVVEDITWNHDVAHNILNLLCDRIGNEELWLFNKGVKGSQAIWDWDFGELCNEDAAHRIKEKLVEYYSNRSLLEVAKNKFVPMWTYGKSTSWGTLNDLEKENLLSLFESLEKKNVKTWKKQSDEIFTALTQSVKMIPCGEDLGVNIPCVPEIMKKHDILGLRVVRWCREWEEKNQPYVALEDYEPLSITTTSVHDSTTMREWLETELKSRAVEDNNQCDEEKTEDSLFSADFLAENETFTADTAFEMLKLCSASASQWFVPPLQDFLYMNKDYWLENSDDERINVPGTVTAFNWTYRLPVDLETLAKDSKLIEKIKIICNR